MSALRSLESEGVKYRSIAAAVRVEVWQVQIRPIYRALFFGFHDVTEVSEDAVAPLCMDVDWLYELSRIALEVLALISRTDSKSGSGHSLSSSFSANKGYDEDDQDSTQGNIWPILQGDVVLESMESRSQKVELSAIETHQAIVSASQLTDDFSTLAYCIPSFEEMFLQHSLFEVVATPSSCTEFQVDFLSHAVVRKAHLVEGPIVDRFALSEIENLGKAWAVDLTQIRAQFLLAMYDVGKDEMVDDLANMGPQQLDFHLFVMGGLEIACMRLHSIVATLRRMPSYRGIVSMLDADTCMWLKEQAVVATQSRSLVEAESIPLYLTHAFILRLLTMCSAIEDTDSSEKAHAMSIMSGTLMSAMQDNDST